MRVAARGTRVQFPRKPRPKCKNTNDNNMVSHLLNRKGERAGNLINECAPGNDVHSERILKGGRGESHAAIGPRPNRLRVDSSRETAESLFNKWCCWTLRLLSISYTVQYRANCRIRSLWRACFSSFDRTSQCNRTRLTVAMIVVDANRRRFIVFAQLCR